MMFLIFPTVKAFYCDHSYSFKTIQTSTIHSHLIWIIFIVDAFNLKKMEARPSLKSMETCNLWLLYSRLHVNVVLLAVTFRNDTKNKKETRTT